MPLVSFEPTDEKKEYAPINIGIILSGGQAPGGHNVICGLYDGLKSKTPIPSSTASSWAPAVSLITSISK